MSKYKLGTEKMVICVGYHDVERVIEKEYGFKEFSIPASEEMGNYVTLEINVDGKNNNYDAKQIIERKQMYMTRTYMNDLYSKGFIKKGIYMIDISW